MLQEHNTGEYQNDRDKQKIHLLFLMILSSTRMGFSTGRKWDDNDKKLLIYTPPKTKIINKYNNYTR